jgi:hypothetical protein
MLNRCFVCPIVFKISHAPAAPATGQAASRHFAPQAGYSSRPSDAEPGEYDLLLENAAATTNLRLGSPRSCPTMTALEFSVRMKS